MLPPTEVAIAQTIPVAQRTVEGQVILENDRLESDQITIKLERPARIVAFVVEVVVSGVPAGGALEKPTIADLMLSIEGNDIFGHLTRQSEGDGTPAGRTFCAASALDSQRRMLFVETQMPTEIRLTARWKNFVDGSPIFEDALISVSVLHDWTDPRGAN